MNILNAGRKDKTDLEKIADTILYIPRKMWLGKSVQLITDSTHQLKTNIPASNNLTHSTLTLLSDLIKSPSAPFSWLIAIAVSALYGATCVIISPLLLIGLPLKKIALLKDSKANQYNLIVRNALLKDSLKTKQIEELARYHAIEQQIEKKPTGLKNLKIKRRQEQKILGQLYSKLEATDQKIDSLITSYKQK